MTASLRINYLAYSVLLGAHIALVWALTYFPTQDGPSHIYNLVILHDLLNGGKEWGAYFSASLHAVPNLGFNLVAYPLLKFLPPLVVEKMVITLYLILMAVSVPVFLRTFDRPVLPLSFLVFPVMFNFTLMMGFYSYALAVPLFLFAFALAWKVRGRSARCRFVSYNVAGLVIYYVHLIPFMLYLLSLAVIAISEKNGFKETAKELIKLICLVSPLCLNLVLYLRTGATNAALDPSYVFSAQRAELITDLLTFSTVSFSGWQLIAGKILMLLVMTLVYVSARSVIRKKFNKVRCENSDKALILMVLGTLLIYLYGPFRFGDGSFFYQRFPWVILLVSLPLLHIPGSPPIHRITTPFTLGIACVFLAVNTIAFLQESTKVRKFVSGFSADIPKGSLVMIYKLKDLEQSRVDVLLNAASYYGIFKGSVNIGNYETGANFFPVKFSNTMPALPSLDQAAYYQETINWSEYPAVQYLFGWDMSSKEKERIGRFFHVIWKDEPFTLWKRNFAAM